MSETKGPGSNVPFIVLSAAQEERLQTLSLSRRGSVESLPARTQAVASESKRMSADFSELEPKTPFPAGNGSKVKADGGAVSSRSFHLERCCLGLS